MVFYLSKPLEVQDDQRTKFVNGRPQGLNENVKAVLHYVMHAVTCCLTVLEISKSPFFINVTSNVLKILIQPAVWTGGCFSVQYMPLQGSSTIQAWREGI